MTLTVLNSDHMSTTDNATDSILGKGKFIEIKPPLRHCLGFMLLLLTVFPSCSTILEDRTSCPCILTVFSDAKRKDVTENGLMINVFRRNGESVALKKIRNTDLDNRWSYSIMVPRENLLNSSLAGVRESRISDDNTAIKIDEGKECDSLFMHLSDVDCKGEWARDTVLLRKQWCTLRIILQDGEKDANYRFTIHGNWDGAILSSLAPAFGPFSCTARTLQWNIFEARIPRQGDNSLNVDLDVEYLDGEIKNVLKGYPIGLDIDEIGFDWGKSDLDDIEITLSYGTAQFSLSALPYYGGQDYGDVEF